MGNDKMPKKILFLSNHYITLYAFRRELIERLTAAGHEVWISMPADERNKYFEDLGCHMITTPMSRRGVNALEDMLLLLRYRRIMRELRPDVVFSYTVKPNIYGSIVSSRLGLKQICNITGTGATFLKRGAVSRMVKLLYRFSVRRAYRVFFQNTGDRDFFLRYGMVGDNWDLLPGSGVNLEQHRFCPMPEGERVSFIYIGRIMAVKGIEQYLDCAAHIRARHPNTRFYIAGFIEEPCYEPLIQAACEKGDVEYLGFQDNIDEWLRRCHCVVLPSLGGEGVPNALLEAAATGRACIASRVSGCIDAVDEGRTGYLFAPGSESELIDKAERFLALNPEQMRDMGLAGREKMERQFDRELVIAKYIKEV